jgi:DNA-binding CsgD family transcriptional regulator
MMPLEIGHAYPARDRAVVRAQIQRVVARGPGAFDALLLTGEPGVGKTTMLNEGVAAARSGGLRVLAATAVEAESSMAYVVLGDLLSPVIDDALLDIPDEQREALDVVLMRSSPGHRPPSVRLIAMAVYNTLLWCAERSTVLVAVDDLQWADAESQQVLVFALRRLSQVPIRLLMALRTSGPFDRNLEISDSAPALLGVFAPEQRVEPGPLSAPEIRALVKSRIGLTLSRGDSVLICTATLGNPMWALELAGVWEMAQREPCDGMFIPKSLRTMMIDRVKALDHQVIDVLCVVSALGRPSVPAAMRAMEGLITVPARALDLAVADGVVVEVDGRLAAPHPLLSTAAMTVLPPGRRLELHRRLVEVAESPEARAHHMALTIDESAPSDMQREVAAAFDESVVSAHKRGAPTHAARLAEQALRFTGPHDDAIDRRRVTAARLHTKCGNLDRALELLDQINTVTLATPLLEIVLPMQAAITYLRSGPDAAQEVLIKVGASDEQDPRRIALLHTLAADRFFGDAAHREEHARLAVHYAEMADPTGFCMYKAILQLIDVKVDAGDGLDLELTARARALESTPAPPTMPYTVDMFHSRALITTDDLAAAQVVLGSALSKARAVADDMSISVLSMAMGEAYLLAGDAVAAATALAESDEATEWAPQWESTHRLRVRTRLLMATGRVDEAVTMVTELGWERSTNRMRRMTAHHLLGLAAVQQGDHHRAVHLLSSAGEAADTFGFRDTGARYRLDTELGEQLVHIGRLDQAARIGQQLVAAGRHGRRCTLVGVGYRILGLCAAADDLEAACGLLSMSVEEHEATQLRPELGRSLLALAQVNMQRRSLRPAREGMERASAIFSAGGLTAWHAETCAELERVTGEKSADVLTAAERRVVTEVLSGASNREVAQLLHVGVRTVESHLARTYKKLGVRSRQELATMLAQDVSRP